jgi:hypothetical protein
MSGTRWRRYLLATGAALAVAFVASTAISVWRSVTGGSDRLPLYAVVPALLGLLVAVWIALAATGSAIARLGVAWRMRWDAMRGRTEVEPGRGLLAIVGYHVFVFVFVDLAMLFFLALYAAVMAVCLDAIVSVIWTGHFSD